MNRKSESIRAAFGWESSEELIDAAIARVIAEGKVRTYDMGGKDSTLDVAKAIAEYAS